MSFALCFLPFYIYFYTNSGTEYSNLGYKSPEFDSFNVYYIPVLYVRANMTQMEVYRALQTPQRSKL